MIESHDKGTLLYVRVKPRSKKPAIIVDEEKGIFVHVKAAPIRGQANAEVLKLITSRLEISIDQVRIISGHKSVNKTLLIEGVEPKMVHAALKN